MKLSVRHPRGLVALGLGLALVLSMLGSAVASSHREAPLITEDPVADNTDVYAFVSPDKPHKVTLISNWIPLQEPAGGPNFYDFGEDVLYTINIDNDGDAIDDVVYEFRFRSHVRNPDTFLYATGPVTSLRDPDFNVRQTYSVWEVRNGRRRLLGQGLPVPPNNVGPRTTPDYDALAASAVRRLPRAPRIKVFAGQRDEAFPVDLGAIFDLGGLRPFNAAHAVPLDPARGKDATAGFNVHSIALQVPKARLRKSFTQPVIGVYSTTLRRRSRVFTDGGAQLSHSGPWVQVSRLGMPLVNEVVIPLRDKNRFNASDPRDDSQFLKHVRQTTLDDTVAALYGGSGAFTCFPDVAGPRDDLVAIFLTGIDGLNAVPGGRPSEMIRLNTRINPSETDPNDQSRAGLLGGDLDGFPNGRRLGDDTVDIALRAVAGATPLGACDGQAPNNALGDGANRNDKPLLTQFPYIPAPHAGYDNSHGRTGSIDPTTGE